MFEEYAFEGESFGVSGGWTGEIPTGRRVGRAASSSRGSRVQTRPRVGPLVLAPELLDGRPFMVVDRFRFDGATLDAYQARLVQRIAAYVVERSEGARPIAAIHLVGYTDARGGAAYNRALGERRSQAVQAALRQAIEALRPGLTTTLSMDSTTEGAAALVAPNTPVAAPRNRRVAVFLVPRGASPGLELEAPPRPAPAPSPARPTPPVSRPCCILAPTIRPFNSTSNIVDPTSMGVHNDPSERTGHIYCGALGFVDLGHLRDLCDFTKFVHGQIVARAGAPGLVTTAHGQAQILSTIPTGSRIAVAQAIAFDDSFGYEIFTYDEFGSPGGHNSSFSPEDLPSNLLGTIVAGRAITRMASGGTFDAAVTTELAALIASAVAQTPTGTLAAFSAINPCWIDFSDVRSLLQDSYLRRRNFTSMPWKAGHPSDTTTPAFMSAGFGAVTTLYDYSFTTGRTFAKSTFPAELTRIRADATTRYGVNFDKPRPCP
jgi:hypothetical protein